MLGLPLFEHAWVGLRRGVLSTDWLLASGVAAAFAASFLSVFRGEGPIYFEVGCVILVMTTLGRWLEATGRLKAGAALDRLAKLLPEQVRRIRDGEETSSRARRFRSAIGSGCCPASGSRPMAGSCRTAGLVDEQVLTGESRPVLKEPGDRILGGTLNLDGDLTIQVTEAGGEITLARVVELVRRARESKGRYQRLADRAATAFVPAVSAIAIAAFGLHWAFGSLERGLWAGLAVGLIACPCALGLAAPLAVWSALGNAAGQRVLFRSGEALERLAEVAAVRFDKTGTLTTGAAAVSRFVCEDDEAETALSRAATLASSSSHAMSRAIIEYVKAGREWSSRARPSPRSGSCRGSVRSAISDSRGRPILLGSRRFLEQRILAGPRDPLGLRGCRAGGYPLLDGRLVRTGEGPVRLRRAMAARRAAR